MFTVLLSSSVPQSADPGRGIAAAAIHLLVITGAIRVTAQAPDAITRPEAQTVVYLAAPPSPRLLRVTATSGNPVVAAPVTVLHPAPVEVPSSIPPVSIGPAIDPMLLRRVMAGGVPGPDAATLLQPMGGFTEAEVDDPARVISQPSPRYPLILQQARIEGRVLVEFVIDTTGHLEAGSLWIVESSHSGFEAPAAETVLGSRFRPARVRGVAVRQRTTQSIVFRIRQ